MAVVLDKEFGPGIDEEIPSLVMPRVKTYAFGTSISVNGIDVTKMTAEERRALVESITVAMDTLGDSFQRAAESICEAVGPLVALAYAERLSKRKKGRRNRHGAMRR